MSVLEGFLVKLGFQVDQDGLKRFQGSLNVATHAVAKVTQAAVGVGVAVAGAFVKANSEVNKLYKISNNTGASIRGIEAMSHAFERVGGSSEEAVQAVNGIAEKIKSGGARFENVIRSRFGVSLTDANGNLRDMTDVVMDLRGKLAKMPPEIAKNQAEFLGLGSAFDTLMKADFPAEFARASREMAAFGDSMDRNATKAHDLQNSLSRVWDTFAAGSKTLAMDFLEASGIDKWFDNLSTSLTKKVPALVKTIGDGMKSYARGEWSISDVVKRLFAKRAADNALAEGDLDAEAEGNPELKALLERARAQQAKVQSPVDKAKEAYERNLEQTSAVIEGKAPVPKTSTRVDTAERAASLQNEELRKNVPQRASKPETAQQPPVAEKAIQKPRKRIQKVLDDDGNEIEIETTEPVKVDAPKSIPVAQPKPVAVDVPKSIPATAPRVDLPKPVDRNAEALAKELKEIVGQAKALKGMGKGERPGASALVREVAGVTNNNTQKTTNVTVNQTINVQGSADPMATAQAVQRETKESINRNSGTNLM